MEFNGPVLYLRKGSIVPDVTMVRENILDKSQGPFLHILFNGIHFLFLTNLKQCLENEATHFKAGLKVIFSLQTLPILESNKPLLPNS